MSINWKKYLQKAEQALCVETTRKTIKEELQKLQEQEEFIDIKYIYDTNNFPFVQVNIRTKIHQDSTIVDALSHESSSYVEETNHKEKIIDFISKLKASDLYKKATSLAVQDQPAKFRLCRTNYNATQLQLLLFEKEGKRAYITIAESY